MSEITGRSVLKLEQKLGLQQFNLSHYHSMQYSPRGLARKQKIERVLRENLAAIERYGRGDVLDSERDTLRRIWRSTRDAHAVVSVDLLTLTTYLKQKELERDDLRK